MKRDQKNRNRVLRRVRGLRCPHIQTFLFLLGRLGGRDDEGAAFNSGTAGNSFALICSISSRRVREKGDRNQESSFLKASGQAPVKPISHKVPSTSLSTRSRPVTQLFPRARLQKRQKIHFFISQMEIIKFRYSGNGRPKQTKKIKIPVQSVIDRGVMRQVGHF